jgi:hypothetical protein
MVVAKTDENGRVEMYRVESFCNAVKDGTTKQVSGREWHESRRKYEVEQSWLKGRKAQRNSDPLSVLLFSLPAPEAKPSLGFIGLECRLSISLANFKAPSLNSTFKSQSRHRAEEGASWSIGSRDDKITCNDGIEKPISQWLHIFSIE